VLGIQNVKSFLRPPLHRVLGGYFPRDDASCVVGMKTTGADNERVGVEMYCSLFVLELTECVVARCCNQSWIYFQKHGDRSLPRNNPRRRSRREPNFASCSGSALLVD
jgi:hypothetical protein